MARNKYIVPVPRFYLEPPNPDGECVIIMKLSYRGLRLVYSTGFKIDPKLWDQSKGRADTSKRTKANIYQLNKHLDNISQVIQDIYVEFNYGDISRKLYKLEISYRLGFVDRPKETGKTLFTFVPAFLLEANEKNNLHRRTCQKYESVFNHLQQYAKDKKATLDFADINWDFRNDFEQWLYDEPREFSQNNAAKIFSVVKMFLREAHRRGLHDNLVFTDNGFGVKRTKTKNKVRFTFDELAALLSYDFSQAPRLERVRDTFILGAYTGLRFSDWHKISKENIITEADGEQYLNVVTQKTKTGVTIYIGKELKQVLERYDYSPPLSSSDGTISPQKFNDYLKEVVKIVLPESKYQAIFSEGGQTKYETRFKWERASSHAARRSFATNYYETGKFAAIDLMLITGHATEKQFFEYIDIDQRRSAMRFGEINKLMRENE